MPGQSAEMLYEGLEELTPQSVMITTVGTLSKRQEDEESLFQQYSRFKKELLASEMQRGVPVYDRPPESFWQENYDEGLIRLPRCLAWEALLMYASVVMDTESSFHDRHTETFKTFIYWYINNKFERQSLELRRTSQGRIQVSTAMRCGVPVARRGSV